MTTKNYEKNRYYLTTQRGIRHIVQIFMFILLNASFLGFTAIWLVLPINQPPTPWSISDGALYVLTNQVVNAIFPFIPLAMFFIIGSLIGKTLCGWVCPFGFFQDILAFFPFKKKYVSKSNNEGFTDASKFLAFVIIIFSFFIGISRLVGGEQGLFDVQKSFGVLGQDPLAALDPASTIFAYFPYKIMNGEVPIIQKNIDLLNVLAPDNLLFEFRIISILFIIILCLFIPRAFCRYLCPTGAVLGLFSDSALLGLNRNLALCNQCGACEAICPMGVRILDHPEKIRDGLCINCTDCVYVCDTGALKLKIE
ncbi:MAG: 4Fe-4S binding protein [Candidatus Thorarchaeota archaeon]